MQRYHDRYLYVEAVWLDLPVSGCSCAVRAEHRKRLWQPTPVRNRSCTRHGAFRPATVQGDKTHQKIKHGKLWGIALWGLYLWYFETDTYLRQLKIRTVSNGPPKVFFMISGLFSLFGFAMLVSHLVEFTTFQFGQLGQHCVGRFPFVCFRSQAHIQPRNKVQMDSGLWIKDILQPKLPATSSNLMSGSTRRRQRS